MSDVEDSEEHELLFCVDPLWDPTGIHWAVILKYIMDHNLDVHESATRNVLTVYDLPTLQILKGLAQQIGVRYLVLEGGIDA